MAVRAAAARVRRPAGCALLAGEQLLAGSCPLFPCSDLVTGHFLVLLFSCGHSSLAGPAWIAMNQQAAAATSVTARTPVRRAVLPAAIEGRAAAAMLATACPLVLRTSRASLSWDGLGRDGLGLQERGVLALKRLGRPRMPAVGKSGGQGVGEDVLLALADPVEDALRDGLGRSLRDVEGADHVGVHRPGQHGVDPHPLSG